MWPMVYIRIRTYVCDFYIAFTYVYASAVVALAYLQWVASPIATQSSNKVVRTLFLDSYCTCMCKYVAYVTHKCMHAYNNTYTYMCTQGVPVWRAQR